MNKRLISGLAVGASAFSFASGESLAQQPDQCAPVYDETTQGVSPDLAREIGTFATNGIKVHVQILKDGAPHGITSKDRALEQLKAYQKQLRQDCGWENTNLLQVTISDNPRQFNTHTEGKTDTLLPEDFLDEYKSSFRDDLKDFDTPHQTDVARFLDRIDPNNKPNSQPEPQKAEASGGGIDVPVIPIFGTLFGLTLLAGTGARIRRGIRVRGFFRQEHLDAENTYTALSGTVTDADELLKFIPIDDARDLRVSKEVSSTTQVQLKDGMDGLKVRYRQEARRLWPTIESMEESAQELRTVTSNAETQSGTTQSYIDELNTYMLKLGEQSNELDAKLEKLHGKADSLLQDGWDIGTYNDQIKGFDALKARIDDLREKSYVEQPGDLVTEGLSQLSEFTDQLTTLPARREAADNDVERQPELVARYSESANTAKAQLDILRAKYDTSCYEDITGLDEKLGAKVSELETLQQKAGALVQVKSLVAVEQTEVLVKKFGETVSSIDTMKATISDRSNHLEEFKNDLPANIEALDKDLVAVQKFVTEQFPSDVEEATKADISEIKSQLSSFKSGELSVEKPAYLKIEQTLDSYRSQIVGATRKARDEKTEMDELRSTGDNMASQASSDLANLVSYVNSHRSDVGGSVDEILQMEVPSARKDLARKGLKKQKQDYATMIASVEAARDKAQRKVREAEAERERRRRQEEEERRRQEAAVYHSNSSYSSGFGSSGGGSDFGGGFSGGGDSGGGFSGGGDSGGGF